MRIWLVLALLVLGAAAFGKQSPRSAVLWLSADISVGPGGRIESLEWKDPTSVGRIVVDHIEPIVRSWEFIPGMVDGAPRMTRTRLSIRARVVEEYDVVSVHIEDAATGAATINTQPPAYPREALKDGVSAEVLAEIEIAADGSISLVGTHFEGSRGTSHRRRFERAAESAIRDWAFRLEEVGGHPVATRMRVPIEFCIVPSRWCEQRQRAATARPVAPGEAVALESVVSLKSDPRTGI